MVDHGDITTSKIEEGLDKARHTQNAILELGINIESLLEELQIDGVKKFADSFESLLSSVSKKQNEYK